MRNLLNIDIPKDPPKNVTSFMKVTKASQFWIWAKKDLIDALFARWNDSGNAMGMRSFMNDKASRRMGFGTIRQIRSKYDTNCKVVPGFETVFDKCKGYSQYHYEDTDSFDVGWWNVVNHSDANPEYIYRTPEELQGSWFEGNQDTYSGGGYVTYLNGSRSQLRAKFERLDAENWIDDQTRAIFVEFSAYNAQVNMFAVVQLVVEVPPFGAFYPWAWVEAVRLDKYVDSNKDVIIFFEAVYCIYAGILLIKEFVTILVVGPKTYLFSIWRMVDFTTMVLAVASVVTYALRLVSITTINAKFQKTNGNFYVKLDQQRDLELLFLVFIGGVVFFVTIKMIKILSFNRRIGLLANTLSRAAGSMLGFGLCFFIVTSAFNTALYMILFAKLENYRNMFVLMMTTFVSILGKFNVGDVIRTSGLGAIIFILFMLVGTVFLLNVFVMIVMYEFEMVRTDSKLQSNDYEVVEHMKSKAMIAAGVFERHNMTNLGLPDVNSTCEPGNRLYAKLNLLLLNAEYLKSSQGPDIVRPNISERLGSLIQ
ncbi:hypothetical protein L596_016995 [Steinernema carpocapsae]|uniref:Uncharacterized protein n=1 Tax=Steinernema carpocapsae TaxID=34508 RepID=A0A4U5N0F6_STECR|nr:hypothetical protein L596_016995 [Steinernema carpocapsae]